MKKLILLITVITFYFSSSAQQNLIPNPSFEEYECIPPYYQQFRCVKDWYAPSPFENTPDYFHKQSPNSDPDYSVNVPNNWLGTQPSIYGDAYMSVHMASNRVREYASVPLLRPLVKGQEYQISFYVAKSPDPSSYLVTTCNGQGVFFEFERRWITDSLITEPDFYSTDIIDADQTWQYVSGTFIADSSYTHMLVGNFLSLVDPRFQSSRVIQPLSPLLSYYFDNFELIETERKFSIHSEKNQDCFPITISFTPNNVQTSDSWKWTFDNGVTTTDQFPRKTYQEPGTYIVRLTTVENEKTYYYTDTIILEQQPLPIADFEINEEFVMNSPINFENLSEAAVSYEWDFGDGNTSEQVSPWHTYTEPNDYIVTLTAYNADGCENTISYPIYITCGGLMNVNVFTPNNDGINDEFSFDSLQICQEFSITIFDRWGRLVFETQDPYQPWDGDEQPSGTYYYLIRYRNGGQEQGYVTLIR
jgi:gliding motility-associated-like protein